MIDYINLEVTQLNEYGKSKTQGRSAMVSRIAEQRKEKREILCESWRTWRLCVSISPSNDYPFAMNCVSPTIVSERDVFISHMPIGFGVCNGL